MTTTETITRIEPKTLELLRDLLLTLNGQNWGLWPDASTWPVPDELGSFTASQYERASGRLATVLKFDRAIELPDGRRGRRIGVGATRPLGFRVLAIDM